MSEITFGSVISDARKSLGISQKDLALKLIKEDGVPISPQYLNDIEHDRRNPPSDDIIENLATTLKINLDYLYTLAKKLPADLERQEISPQQAQAAWKAFRKALK